MCTSSEMLVTVKSMIAERPSTSVPAVKCTPPDCHQVKDWTTGSTAAWPPSSAPTAPKKAARACSPPSLAALTRSIHWTRTPTAPIQASDRAAMPTREPPFGMRLPKNKMTRNDARGMAGMTQAFSRKNPAELS